MLVTPSLWAVPLPPRRPHSRPRSVEHSPDNTVRLALHISPVRIWWIFFSFSVLWDGEHWDDGGHAADRHGNGGRIQEVEDQGQLHPLRQPDSVNIHVASYRCNVYGILIVLFVFAVPLPGALSTSPAWPATSCPTTSTAASSSRTKAPTSAWGWPLVRTRSINPVNKYSTCMTF